jgi:transcriptional regulator with XRE-family HTH domain
MSAGTSARQGKVGGVIEDVPALEADIDPRARALGERIRTLRRSMKLTLSQLAERVGVSIGTLSQTERGLGSPSVRILYDLATVFSVSPAWLIDPGSAPTPATQNPFIVRANQRQPFVKNGGMTKELISPTGVTLFNGFYVEMEPGAGSGDKPYTHFGEEIGYVVTGTVEMEIDGKVYILGAGDCFGFPSTFPHQFRNIGAGRAVVFWVNSRA